jgi:hypothetical protein
LSEILDVFKSSNSIASIASIVLIRRDVAAVNKLLLTETDFQRLTLELHLIGFMSSSGSKGPARSTLSLILNSGNDVLVSPVSLRNKANINGFYLDRGSISGMSELTKIESHELFLSQVRELVDSHFVGLGGVSIVLLHGSEIVSEKTATIEEFRLRGNGLIELAEIGQVLNRLVIHRGLKVVKDCGSCE